MRGERGRAADAARHVLVALRELASECALHEPEHDRDENPAVIDVVDRDVEREPDPEDEHRDAPEAPERERQVAERGDPFGRPGEVHRPEDAEHRHQEKGAENVEEEERVVHAREIIRPEAGVGSVPALGFPHTSWG